MTPKLEWQLWRSREIRFVKPHVNGRGEDEYRDKDGKTYPAETMRQQYERLPDEPKADG